MAGDLSGQEAQQQFLTRGTRLVTRLTAAAGVWFLCFVGGGAWLAYRLFHSVSSSCPYGVAGCAGHDPSLAGPIALLIVGFFVTGVVASIVSVRYLGRGATAFLRARRTSSLPVSTPPPWTGGPPPGTPPWLGGMPPGGPPPGGELLLEPWGKKVGRRARRRCRC